MDIMKEIHAGVLLINTVGQHFKWTTLIMPFRPIWSGRRGSRIRKSGKDKYKDETLVQLKRVTETV